MKIFNMALLASIAVFSQSCIDVDELNIGISEMDREMLIENAAYTVCDPEFVYLECAELTVSQCHAEITDIANQCLVELIDVAEPYLTNKEDIESLRIFSHKHAQCIIKEHIGYGKIDSDTSDCIDKKLNNQ